MTWAVACRAMVEGKRVRLPHWNHWVSIGFGALPYMNVSSLTDGHREFAPERAHLLSADWEIADKALDKTLDKTPKTPGSNEPDISPDKPADILFGLISGEGLCDRCRVPLKLGVAPKVVQVGHGDFLGDDGSENHCTMNDHWPGGLMECWKCPQCGKSWTVVAKC